MNQDETQTAKHSESGQQSDINTEEATSQQQGEGGSPESAEEMSHEQLLLTLQDAQAKADQHWNQLLLARAELDNNRRRNEREVENAHKYALEKFVRELLPVKDSLELGIGLRTFRQTQEQARANKVLAANQGLYNGFLAAGLIWGLILGSAGLSIKIFFLGCVLIAGLFGAATANRKILFFQAMPAAIGIVLLMIA